LWDRVPSWLKRGEFGVAIESNDGIVYLALVFEALAAVLSAPADASVTYQKLRWLLMQDSTAETTTTAGALGESMTFPVSP
jgi:hypothetical protein